MDVFSRNVKFGQGKERRQTYNRPKKNSPPNKNFDEFHEYIDFEYFSKTFNTRLIFKILYLIVLRILPPTPVHSATHIFFFKKSARTCRSTIEGKKSLNDTSPHVCVLTIQPTESYFKITSSSNKTRIKV